MEAVAPVSRPRLLDLFCGAGGAAMGYHRAGFDVVGVDIKPQPRYPFRFVQGDALDTRLISDIAGSDGIAAIHASPPCQAYAITNNIWKNPEKYPDLVVATREMLRCYATPWIIENVPGAPLVEPIVLCGDMFGLRVIRHRLFESSFFMLQPRHTKHTARASYGRTPKNGEHYTISGHFGDVAGGRLAMGIPWMTRDELSQAIPPAYTEFVGAQLIRAVMASCNPFLIALDTRVNGP